MPRMLPSLAAAFLFFALSGASEGMAARYISPDLENRVALGLAALGAGFGFLCALAHSPRRLIGAAVSAWPLIAFVALAGASRYWSSAPTDSLQSAIHLMLIASSAICIATFSDWPDILAGGALAVLTLGLLSVVLIPAGGLMSEIHPGALRGPWGEKNEAGMIYAFGALCFIALAAHTRRYAWLIGTAALIPLLILSKSTTSLLAFSAGVIILLAIEWVKGRPARLLLGSWLAVVMVAVIGLAMVTNVGDVLEAAGKDTTLTGRSAIWPAIMDRIAERPWLGHGYNAFWAENAPDKLWLWEEIQFQAHNAHNGVLETLLGLGIIGFILLGWFTLRTFIYGVYGAANADDPRRFVLPLMICFLIISFSESIISGPDGLIWLALMTLCVAASMRLSPYQIPMSSMRLYAGRSRTLSSQAFVAGAPSNPNLCSPFWIWKPIKQSAAEKA